MSHLVSRPSLAYRRVPARRRGNRLLTPVLPHELGFNSYRIHWLCGLFFAFVNIALLLETLAVLGDQLQAIRSWHFVHLAALVVLSFWLLVAGSRRRVLMWPLTVFSAVVVLAVLTLPLAWGGTEPAQDPWIQPFVLQGAISALIAWGVRTAVAYLGAVTSLYAVSATLAVQRAEPTAVVFDAVVLMASGSVVVTLLGLVFQAGRTADEVYAQALAEQLQLNRSRSQAEEQERLDRLIHDNVMAALLDAGRAPGAVQRRTRELAQRALDVLDLEEGRAEGKGTTMVHTLLDDLLEAISPWRSRVRFNSITPYIRPPGEPRPLLPAETALALVQAVTEAVSNSARHSGSDTTYVTMDGGVCPPTPVNPEGFYLRFQVVDRGRGFLVRNVDSRRLGVRVSIVGNVQHVGGAVDVDAVPGRGTRVTILWPRDARP